MSSTTDSAVDPDDLSTDAPGLGDGEALHIHGKTGAVYAHRINADTYQVLYTGCGLLEKEGEFEVATLADDRGYERVPLAETPFDADGSSDGT